MSKKAPFYSYWRDKALAYGQERQDRLFKWAKHIHPPGFAGLSLYEIAKFVIEETQRFDLGTRANSMAYSFFISLFPSLLTLFTFLPFLQRYFLKYLPEGENFNHYLQEEIHKIMPGKAGDQLFGFIYDITATPRIGLMSFGFLLALYFSSNGVMALMKGFEKVGYESYYKIGGVKKRLISIALTALLGVLLIASIVLIILGNFIIHFLSEYIHLDWFTTFSIMLLRWLSILFLFYFGIAVIYRFGATSKAKIPFFSPGTTLATFLSIATSVAFSMYIDDFGRYSTYNKFYGSIATIIILMLWIQLNSFILLVGYELNAVVAISKYKQAEEDADSIIKNEQHDPPLV